MRFRSAQPSEVRAKMLAARISNRLKSRAVKTCWHCNIDIYPHQLECIYKALGMERKRLMYCDEPGLGKTIEVGLTIKELYETGEIDNALIVCPASLRGQWISELQSKLKMHPMRIEELLEQSPERRPAGVFIVSLPFLRSNQDIFDRHEWDLVAFDEAHHLAWRGGKQSMTRSYRLAQRICAETKHVLLATATPIQLSHFDFWSLINLVRPDLFPTYERFETFVQTALPFLKELERRSGAGDDILQDLALLEQSVGFSNPHLDVAARLRALALLEQVVIRHRKRDEITNMVGRQAVTQVVNYTAEERTLYEDAAAYISSLWSRSRQENNRGLGLFAVVLRQLLTSSPKALLATIRRRIESINEMLDDWDDDEDFDRESAVQQLEGLENFAQRIESMSTDTKRDVLLDAVSRILLEHPGEKVIVFTRFIETQRYLRNELRQQYAVTIFNGKMGEDEKDAAIEEFRNHTQVLICTDAGGEGRNLQFAHIIINYDLPWNPVRLEQRIGRVDRLGQTREVLVINMATWDTVEQTIFERLVLRLAMWQETLGDFDPMVGESNEDHVSRLIINGDSNNELIERLFHERLSLATQASSGLARLRVFRRDDELRSDVNKDIAVTTDASTVAEFVHACVDAFDGYRIAAQSPERMSVEKKTQDGLRAYDVDLRRPDDGLVKEFLGKCLSSSPVFSTINDSSGMRKCFVLVTDAGNEVSYLAQSNGKDWFLTTETPEIGEWTPGTRDVDVASIQAASSFVHKLTRPDAVQHLIAEAALFINW